MGFVIYLILVILAIVSVSYAMYIVFHYSDLLDNMEKSLSEGGFYIMIKAISFLLLGLFLLILVIVIKINPF